MSEKNLLSKIIKKGQWFEFHYYPLAKDYNDYSWSGKLSNPLFQKFPLMERNFFEFNGNTFEEVLKKMYKKTLEF